MDARILLTEHYEKIYGKWGDAPAEDDAAPAGEDENEDIDDLIAKEIQGLKKTEGPKPTQKRLWDFTSTGCKGVEFLSLNNPEADPHKIVLSIFEEIQKNPAKVHNARHVRHLTPVQATCYPSIEKLQPLLRSLLEQHYPARTVAATPASHPEPSVATPAPAPSATSTPAPEAIPAAATTTPAPAAAQATISAPPPDTAAPAQPVSAPTPAAPAAAPIPDSAPTVPAAVFPTTYAVHFKCRNNNAVSCQSCIDLVRDTITELGYGGQVRLDWKQPQLMVVIEILQRLLGVTVSTAWGSTHKFNLQSFAVGGGAEPEAAGGPTASRAAAARRAPKAKAADDDAVEGEDEDEEDETTPVPPSASPLETLKPLDPNPPPSRAERRAAKRSPPHGGEPAMFHAFAETSIVNPRRA
ncbi:hypothetical protein PAPYR_1522 [Paratrimastix pyriformis]|uniref:THUMP domain-containing protein n=1 Tax=Paratrimastix pyriformis TaxID=342808 RepID=A0ABQ8URU2_9EUKA|nr:hypothetical protein PAPYR_1522 [Paratrimastix pyriformis]